MQPSQEPLYALNREKEYAQELQGKYESQVMAHSRTEGRIAELEILLEREKQRTREMRMDLVKELDNEKLMRSHAE